MKQIELLKWGKSELENKKVEEADIKAKKLIEFVLNQSRSKFILNELKEVLEEKKLEYKKYIEEIVKGKPIQYITNSQEFMGLDFYVDENVLIPQPDTEILVEETIKILNNTSKTKVLDLCTGSGAIAVSLAHYCKTIEVIGADIDDNALQIAMKNARKHVQNNKITFAKSDMFKQIQNRIFDVIVSNPPYIETKEIQNLSNEVQHEPKLALDGGEDGLKFYKEILEQSANFLNSDGYLLFEIGYDQGDKIIKLYNELKKCNKCLLEIITEKPIKDLGGNDRVMIFKKR